MFQVKRLKFEKDQYEIYSEKSEGRKFLIPTAEVPLSNLFRENNIDSEEVFREFIRSRLFASLKPNKAFIDVFNEQFDQEKFPIPVKEIRIIEDSHTAISRGCLSEAQLIEEEENENT